MKHFNEFCSWKMLPGHIYWSRLSREIIRVSKISLIFCVSLWCLYLFLCGSCTCLHACGCTRLCTHTCQGQRLVSNVLLHCSFFRNDLSLICETAVFARLAGQGSPGIWRCPPPPQHWRMCFYMGIWDPNSSWYHRQQAIPWAISQLLGTCRNQEYNGGVARIVRIREFLK